MSKQHEDNNPNGHEILDDTVEFGAFVTETEFGSIFSLSSCQRAEVFNSLRDSLSRR